MSIYTKLSILHAAPVMDTLLFLCWSEQHDVEQTMNIADETIEVAGMRTHYLRAGTGSPLLLLHGLGDSAQDWHWVMPALVQRYRVYAPDLPGSGTSAKPPADYSPRFYARFVHDFLDAVGVADAAIAGHSFGGLTAICFALAAPARVRALVLVDSAGLGREVNIGLRLVSAPAYGDVTALWAQTPPGNIQRMLARTALQFARPGRVPRAWLADQYRLAQQPGFLPATLRELRAQVNLAGQRNVVLDQLPRLTMPTLLIWGDRDQVVPVHHAHAALAQLQGGQLTVIPDCGHVPHVEQPKRFANVLRTFLDEQVQG